jgi:hypothetical protein
MLANYQHLCSESYAGEDVDDGSRNDGSGPLGPQDRVVRGSRHHHHQPSFGVVSDIVVCDGLRWINDEHATPSECNINNSNGS